jgi:hypothetical protein
MKTDGTVLNELERAVLNRMQHQLPALSSYISELTLSHRKLTGVGSFTNFAIHDARVPVPTDSPLALDVHILMPGVQNGLGALLFFNVDRSAFLEIFSNGDDGWSGTCEGFSFVEHG